MELPSGSKKVVFFDAAGTLFRVRGSVGEVYLQYAEKYGVTATPELVRAVEAAFRQVFREAPPPVFSVDRPEKLKQCERLWWFDIVHAVFYRVGLFDGFDEYFDDVYEAFGRATHWEVFPDVIDALKALRQKGFELGIISNFDTRFFEILRGLGLQPLFDSITISSLAGGAKPSPKIFHHALEQHAIDPEEAVHVGDHVREDVQGANDSGMTGIYLNRSEQQMSSGLLMIRSLTELPALMVSFTRGTA